MGGEGLRVQSRGGRSNLRGFFMLFRLGVLLGFIGSSAFAVLPTISCELPDKSLVFEEGIDEFNLDIKGYSRGDSFIGLLLAALKPPTPVAAAAPMPATPAVVDPLAALRLANSPSMHLAQIKLPKRDGSPIPDPNRPCRFSQEKPLMLLCQMYGSKQDWKLTDVGTGTSTESSYGYLIFSSQRMQTESLDSTGRLTMADILRFQIRMNLLNPGSPGKEVTSDIDFPMASCKSGERSDSPSR